MISVFPYDDELLNGVYANIGLIADKVWAFDSGDPFRKLNRTLWVQNCKLTEKYRENGNSQPRRVRDIIPESWLAQYGDYGYSEERERLYKPEDDTLDVHPPDLYIGDVTEPWMLEDVEKHFDRLSTGTLLPLDDELFSHLQSSTREVLVPTDKLTDRGTGWIWRSKWDEVLKKRYPSLASALAGKNSTGEIESCSSNTTIPKVTHVVPDNENYPPPRYSVDNLAEINLQMLVTSNAVRDLWNHSKPQQLFAQYPQHLQQQRRPQSDQQAPPLQQQQQMLRYRPQQCGQQQQHNFQQQQSSSQLQSSMRFGRPESAGMMRRPLPPILSAEVPEFFPKGPGLYSNGRQERTMPLTFFPSSTERSYQDELFPYNRGHVPSGGVVFQSTNVPVPQPSTTSGLIRCPQQWIQRPGPSLQVQLPLCSPPQSSLYSSARPIYQTVIQPPVQMLDKIPQSNQVMSTPIPVYQRPPELYADPAQKRKNQGVDFNNLILLTKNAMKARRNQSKNPQQNSSFILESRQPNLKSEADVLQWLDKGFPRRAKEFVTVNTLVSEFQDFEQKCECPAEPEDLSEPKTLTENPSCASPQKKMKDDGVDPPAKRRLYRDVLTNSSSTGIILDNAFDKRYDDLEQQAMEQYRTSEECLALRYQELERQALEQYKNGDNSVSNSTKNQGSSKSLTTDSTARGKLSVGTESIPESKDCTDGHKCSGFGQCSPVKESPPTSKTGTPSRQKITILRPEIKHGSSATHRGVYHKNARPPAVTKSLTTLNQTFSRESKNITRGGSGDKNDRHARVLPKRRLSLLSPLKREARARLPKTSNLGEAYNLQATNRHVSASCGKFKTGCGDVKLTLLRSPGAEAIRKQLFPPDEDLSSIAVTSESLGVALLEPKQAKLTLEPSTEEYIRSVTTGKMNGKQGHRDQFNRIPKRTTKNEKQQCEPHEVIAIIDPHINAFPARDTSSTSLLQSDEGCDATAPDLSRNCNCKFDEQRRQRKAMRSFESSILETIQQSTGYYCVPIYDILKGNSTTFVKKNLSSEDVRICVGNKWFLRIRYHESLSSTRNMTSLLCPYHVIALLYDSGKFIMLERLKVTL